MTETRQQLRDRLFAGGSFASVGAVRGRQILAELCPPGGAHVALTGDRSIPADPPVPVRVYHPAPNDVLPVLVWVHGGGWCLGDLETTDTTCRALATGANHVVVSVDHRLAPEHPYPEPLDDVTAVLDWVMAHAADVGGDSDNITMGGESAGANLAIAACLSIFHREQRAPAGLLLVVPVVDLDLGRPSMIADADPNMPVTDLLWFADQYAPDPVTRTDPLVAPLNADTLAELPPAIVVTAGADALHDGGQDLVRALRRDHVPVTHLDYADAPHGFFAKPDTTGQQALTDVITALRDADASRHEFS